MFVLDPRIKTDSIFICDLELCQLRVQNDQRYPWLVLVPKVTNATEVHELSTEMQAQLMAESSAVAEVLKAHTGCTKINVANLGNVVSQLHWHVLARFENDLTWPGPVWGVGAAKPYEEKELARFIEQIKASLLS